MGRLTRDGAADPVSRDQILRREREQGNIHFSCSADHEQDWQPYPVDPYLVPLLFVTMYVCMYACHVCVCCVFFPFILDIKFVGLDVPAGVTQEEGHTGFLFHLPSAVRALIFLARRIQPFLCLVDREFEACVLTI